ncbi:MAG: cytochrome c oxidase subunit I [Spongiibacteraceae bacterium]|jgi:cytochrome c oxidase subunit I+III|nr:cytochrome c oxidase subunit I [Spongiibacteraceae bacterium]
MSARRPAAAETPKDPAHLRAEFSRVWVNPRGWRSLSVVNHTAIAYRFLITGTVFFVLAGLMAMLMRTQLALPQHDFVDHKLYNQLFTMHGTVMMFLFAVPMMEALAVYLIPKMIGARDLAYPRLSAFGYWCYLFGGIIILSSLALQMAPDSGWFMYTPLSNAVFSPGRGPDVWLLGITFVEISAVAAGVELIVSILCTRAAGMSLDKMPLFAWYILATAGMIIIGFPPLILASILLELERAANLPFFDVVRGGDPLLWQHLFWLFGHPEVYIIFLPAAGVVSTLVPVFAQRPIIGYRWAVLAVIGTAFISFGLWVHHMFTVGIPQLALAFFSAASMMVAIPTGIQVFVWLATLWYGRPRYSLPMLWLAGFFFIFVAGGLTGVMLALVPFDWQVHDTHFVVAHFHYVLVGGMLFPLIAGIYYWLPHFSGRMPSERVGRWAFWLTFLGFNGTFLIMHWTGLLGMPRRIYTYEAGLGWDLPNLISSVSGFVLAIGTAMMLADIALHFRFGRRADPNPWQSNGLEWVMPLPAPPYNFLTLPTVDSRDPLWSQPALAETLQQGEQLLPEIDHGLRETLGSDPVTARPRQIVHLPTNSWWPLAAAAAIGALCLALLGKVYGMALVATVIAAVCLLRWSWENGAHASSAPLAILRSGPLPLHSRTFDSVGRYGMITTLLASGALYFSLLFAWYYLWAIAPEWLPPAGAPLSWTLSLLAGTAATAACALHTIANLRLRRGVEQQLGVLTGAAALMGTLQLGLMVWTLHHAGLQPTLSAHDALVIVMFAFVGFHTLVAVLATALQCWRVHYGYVSLAVPYEVPVVTPLWSFSAACFWLGWLSIMIMPQVWLG